MDCIASQIKVSFATVHSFFTNFANTKEEFYSHMTDYAQRNLHRVIKSMDATHVTSIRIPSSIAHTHTSFKSCHPSRSYNNMTVNHKNWILHSTRGFPARMNDKSVVRYDKFYVKIKNGEIGDDVEFSFYYTETVTVTGKIKFQQYSSVWMIVDNGYLSESVSVLPTKSTRFIDELVWSKWLESVRKDVECTFGILKGRFEVLQTPPRYHSIERMDNVWMTCCSLNNRILDYDEENKLLNVEDKEWPAEYNNLFGMIKIQPPEAETVCAKAVCNNGFVVPNNE